MTTHLLATGVLVTDLQGRVLLVSNPYRDTLVQVGGMVEPGETPAAAAEREVLEEVGLDVRVTRLLVVHFRPAGQHADTVLLTFDTDPVDSAAPLVLQPEEISAAFWLPPTEALARHSPAGRQRLTAALDARNTNTTIYLDGDRRLTG